MCYAYHHLHGIDVTVFQYFTVYGPVGRPDMSPFRFVQWISKGQPLTVFGDGQQSRDFTCVDDIARGTIAGLEPVGYETFNWGSDSPVILIDAIRRMENIIVKKANIEYQTGHAADMRATWADISSADKMLVWRPQMKFDDGVRRLVNWYQENPDWAGQLDTTG